MIGTVGPVRPHAPEIRGKHQNRQKEENARHFKPQDATHALKRLQESAYAAGDSAAGLSGNAPGGLFRILDPGRRTRRLLLLAGHRGLRRTRQLLARHAPGNTQSRAKDPPNDLWSHSVYDGSSDAG